MTAPPKLALLIPTYNGSECIGDVLQSIVRWCKSQSLPAESSGLSSGFQSIPPVYIFDDCSTDGTIRTAMEWQNSLPLHVVRNERNLGEYGNVNHAIVALQSLGFDWVMLLHQDDLLAGPWVQTCLELIETPDPALGMICCSNLYCDRRDTASVRPVPRPEKLTIDQRPGTVASIHSLRHSWFWTVPGSVFQTAAFMETGGFHPLMKFAGDNDFLVRFMLAGHTTFYVKWPAILKRNSDNNGTNRANDSGVDIVCWAYVMLRYLPLASKADRTIEFCVQAKRILRRTVSLARRGRTAVVPAQLRSLALLFQSYCALITGSKRLIPPQVRALIDFRLDPLLPADSSPAGSAAILIEG